MLCQGLTRGDTGYSLPIGLQLADFKEYHEIIFAVAGADLGAGHSRQLGGRYCVGRGDSECQTGFREAETRLVANSRELL